MNCKVCDSEMKQSVITRRGFLKGVTAGSVLPCVGCFSFGSYAIPYADILPYTSFPETGRWYKGNTHVHTYRSDGRAFPQEVAALYRRIGWDFLALTDHNVVHESNDEWYRPSEWYYKHVVSKNWPYFEKDFPDLLPEVRVDSDGRHSYRFSTFDELSARLNEREKFLLISGNELTIVAQNGDNLHCNILNVRNECSVERLPTVEDCLDWCVKKRDEWVESDFGKTLFTLNHPLWRFFDVRPETLIRHPTIRFFEVANVRADPMYPPLPEKALTHDKFWDVANTMRALKGLPLVYGVASDDTHQYEDFYKPEGLPFFGYSMVRARSLSIDGLIDAFWRGNFYATTGVTLKDVSFDLNSRRLIVEVDPIPGLNYRIEFIGTRRGASTDVIEWIDHEVDAKSVKPHVMKLGFRLKKRLPVYSEKIGEVFSCTYGIKASYVLGCEDLYVRARVSVVRAGVKPGENCREVHVAWTQPIKNEWICV